MSNENFANSRRHLLKFLAIGAGVGLSGCKLGTVNSNGPIRLVYATPYSPRHPFSRADSIWMDHIKSATQARVNIIASWSGAILSSDQSINEIRHKLVDIGLITPIYAKGGAHLLRAQSGFYSGITEIEKQVELYRCLEANTPEFDHEVTGLKILAVQGGSLPGIVTREKQVKTLKDLSSLRLRVPSELVEVMNELGVDAVNMPMGEVYSAMAKGVIDGVVAPPDTFKALHFAEVAKYFTNLKVPRGAYPARAMNKSVFDSLPEDIKSIFEASIAVWERALANEIRKANDDGLKFALESGVEEIDFPQSEQIVFDELYLKNSRANAEKLKRYNMNGSEVFDLSRRSVLPNGDIECAGAQ